MGLADRTLVKIHGRQWTRSSLVMVMFFTCSAPSHYLNQCWVIVISFLTVKISYDIKTFVFIQEMRHLKCRLKMSAILLMPWCINPWWRHQMETFSALLAICAVNSPGTGEFPAQRSVTRSFDFSLICVWINGWVSNCEAGDLRRYRAHYDVTVMHPRSIASA